MKKITPVFGPQELFDACLNDVVCVSKNDDTGEIFQYTNIIIALRDLTKYKGNSDFTVAMRRNEEAPDSIDLSGDIDRLIEPEFSEWWENYGQLVGSGGGDRERTFAFAAFRYLMPKILGQKQPEPKRWTVADQKAGRLPEVGGECRHCQSKLVKSVIAATATHIVIDANNGVGVAPYVLRHDEFMQYYTPIETPEEKAQREEDDFVAKHLPRNKPILCGTGFQIYERGFREAYQILSGDLHPVQAKDGE